jgi:GTP-binding protein EngB required for normal cell division
MEAKQEAIPLSESQAQLLELSEEVIGLLTQEGINKNILILELLQKIEQKMQALNKFISSNKGHTNPAKKLERELERLKSILQKEIAYLLDMEGIDDIPGLLKTIEEKIREFNEYVANKQEDTNPARELAEELEKLKAINILNNCVLTVNTNADKNLSQKVDPSKPQSAVPSQKSPSLADVAAVPRPIPRHVRSLSIAEQETIQESFKRATQMPDCAEKNLSMLYLHFQLKVKRGNSELLAQEEIIKAWASFKDQWRIENVDCNISEYEMERIETALAPGNIDANFKFLADEFLIILKKIQPLDMELMIQLIDKTKAAAKKIENKDIILLLGGTGAGKSTTIHFMAGSHMQRTIVSGIRHIASDGSLPELDSFVATPFSRSETRSINAIEIELSHVGAQSKGVMVLCDSPGFGDTDGAEIDIANGIGIVKAVQQCKSVKPVILISQQSIGDRSEGITKLSHTLVMFISSIEKYLNTFSYIFTKFDKDDQEVINARLDNQLNHLGDSERTNAAFVALLRNMVEKTKERAYVLDLLEDSPADLLDQLVATPAISDPSTVFKNFVTPASMDKLKEQLFIHQRSILSALDRKDMQTCCYKLDQIKRLNQVLDLHESQKIYNECTKEITQHIERLKNEISSKLESCLLGENAFIKDDLTQCLSNIRNLLQLEEIRISHLSNFLPGNLSDFCMGSLQRIQYELLESVKGKDGDNRVFDESNFEIKQEEEPQSIVYENPLTDLARKVSLVDKMTLLIQSCRETFLLNANTAPQSIQECLSGLEASYRGACDHVWYLFQQSHSIIPDLIENRMMDVYVKQMDYMKYIIDSFKTHVDIDKLEAKYSESQISLGGLFQSLSDRAIALFEKDYLAEEDIQQIYSVLNELKQVQKTEGLHQHISTEKMSIYYHRAIASSEEYFKKTSTMITKLLKENNFSAIKIHLITLDQLRKIPEIMVLTEEDIYKKMILQIQRHINQVKEQAFQILSLVSHYQANAEQCEALRHHLTALKEASYFSDCAPELYNQELDIVVNQIGAHLERIEQQLALGTCDLEYYNQAEIFAQIIQQAQCLKFCEAFIPGLSLKIDAMVDSFSQKVSNVLDNIKHIFSSPENYPLKVELPTIKNALAYLHACSIISLPKLGEQIRAVKDSTAVFIETHFSKIAADLDASFRVIQENGAGEEALSFAIEQVRIGLQYLDDLRLFYARYPLSVKVSSVDRNALLREEKADAISSEEHNFYHFLFEDQPKKLRSLWCDVEDTHLTKQLSTLKSSMEVLEKTSNLDGLYANMFMAKKLSSWDSFLSGIKYSQLVIEFEAIIRRLNDSVISDMRLALKTQRYKDLGEAIAKLDLKQPGLKEACDSLCRTLPSELKQSINDLQEKIKGLSLGLGNNESLRFCLKELQKLYQAQQYLLKYLESEQQEFSNDLTKLEKQITEKVTEFSRKIKLSIQENRFFDTEKFLQAMQGIISHFEASVPGYMTSFKQELAMAQNNYIDEVRKKLIDIEKRYLAIEVDQFPDEPPVKLLGQLRLASPYNHIYKEQEAKLTEIIQTKILARLKTAEEMENTDDAEAVIKQIESMQTYLPIELYGKCDAKLNACKAHIQNLKEQSEREIKEQEEAGASSELINKLEQYAKRLNYTAVQQTKEAIKRLMQREERRVNADLEKGDLAAVFRYLPKVWKDWANYISCLERQTPPSGPRVTKRYQDIYKDEQGLAMREKMLDTILMQYTNSISAIQEISGRQSDTLKVIAIHFNKMTAFLALKKNAPRFYAALLKKSPTLEDQVKAAFTKIESCFIALQGEEAFLEKLRIKDFSKLEKIMNMAKEDESLFENAKCYAATSLSVEETPRFSQALQNCLSYKELKRTFTRKILDWKDSVGQAFLHNTKTSTMNATDRDEFYKEISNYYQLLKQAKSLAGHIDVEVADLGEIEKWCQTHIKEELGKIAREAVKYIDIIPSIDMNNYIKFNMAYDNLRSFADSFKDSALTQTAKSMMGNIDNMFDSKLNQLREKLLQEKNYKQIGNLLITMRSIAIHIPIYKKKIDDILEQVLLGFAKELEGSQKIGMLGAHLNNHQENSSVAQMIIAEYTAFKGYALLLRNEKTSRSTVENILDLEKIEKGVRPRKTGRGVRSEGDLINESILYEKYKFFDAEYWRLVEKGLLNLRSVKSNIQHQIKLIADGKDAYEDKVIKLMVHVFAYWTLERSNHYVEARDVAHSASAAVKQSKPAKQQAADVSAVKKSKFGNYLMQPHAAQVIAIFRLLGVDKAEPVPEEKGVGTKIMDVFVGVAAGAKEVAQSLGVMRAPADEAPARVALFTHDHNHLIQIGTGEGKSVTLAVTAVILALLGYDVDCACYSEYLSNRDFRDFISLFDAFGLRDAIHYGTFNKLSEDFINQRGDVRALVESTIRSEWGERGAAAVAGKPAKFIRPKILLIDEVDVFFNKDFYGNIYRPLVKLVDPSVTALIHYIWSIKDRSLDLKLGKIRNSAAYQECHTKFGRWGFLVDNAVKAMLSDIANYESHDYIVLNDRIGYKDQDSISFAVNYGYKTLFAYFKEHAAGKISPERLESMIGLSIDCGSFSYAEIPTQYDCVMGVTGTLATLSRPERSLLEGTYKIKKYSYMPSVYGDNQLDFARDVGFGVIIESEGKFFDAIMNEINTRLQSDRGERAVLVFFESTPKLKAFYKSNQLRPIQPKVRVLTEETSPVEKESIIRKAVTLGSVTLLVKVFGRGTDFICYDDHLNTAGGVHVIQTFFSDELSEETQIMGRTARQGNKGSFSMVLVDETLERFGISKLDIDRMKSTNTRYTTINKKRCNFFEGQYPDNIRYVKSISADHRLSQNFVDALLTPRRLDEVESFLLQRNKVIFTLGEMSRTIVLMDATGSMSRLLEKSKITVKTMFEQAYEVLKDEGFESAFELQFAVYRNYSSKAEMILQYSTWESKPENLRVFMDGIKTKGGQGNEAIEIGLSHVNAELQKGKVTQVILIGDMPPNTRDEVSSNRAGSGGEAYWRKTKYAVPTYYQEEVSALRQRGVPIHAFYIKESARAVFMQIAQATGGQCEELDINSSEGAVRLTKLITEQILRNVGGAERGEQLVSAYRAKFERGYMSVSPEDAAPALPSPTTQAGMFGQSSRRLPKLQLQPQQPQVPPQRPPAAQEEEKQSFHEINRSGGQEANIKLQHL